MVCWPFKPEGQGHCPPFFEDAAFDSSQSSSSRGRRSGSFGGQRELISPSSNASLDNALDDETHQLIKELRSTFNKGLTKLLLSLYPIQDQHQETLSSEQTIHFNTALQALEERFKLQGINTNLLDITYDGNTNPLPFPDLHWELVAAWFTIDGTIPSPITLSNGEALDYYSILMKDPSMLQRWKKKVEYATTGFRFR